MPGQRGAEAWRLRDLFARAEGCRSLETFSLPGKRGVESSRDLFARAEGCGSLETFSLPGQRGVEAWRPVCQGRGVWKLLETCLPGQRGVEAWRPSVYQGRGV